MKDNGSSPWSSQYHPSISFSTSASAEALADAEKALAEEALAEEALAEEALAPVRDGATTAGPMPKVVPTNVARVNALTTIVVALIAWFPVAWLAWVCNMPCRRHH
jgi:hypothetical protein